MGVGTGEVILEMVGGGLDPIFDSLRSSNMIEVFYTVSSTVWSCGAVDDLFPVSLISESKIDWCGTRPGNWIGPRKPMHLVKP